jgi:hypothetical protein
MWWALQRHLSDALTPYIAQLNYVNGASGRNRTGMPAMNEATDFKSVVSTNFTTEAHEYYGIGLGLLLSRHQTTPQFCPRWQLQLGPPAYVD